MSNHSNIVFTYSCQHNYSYQSTDSIYIVKLWTEAQFFSFHLNLCISSIWHSWSLSPFLNNILDRISEHHTKPTFPSAFLSAKEPLGSILWLHIFPIFDYFLSFVSLLFLYLMLHLNTKHYTQRCLSSPLRCWLGISKLICSNWATDTPQTCSSLFCLVSNTIL